MAYILTRKNPIVTETKTGSILTFNSALPVVADDVSSLISGYQEGSGTPSPSNPRNLVSFSSCTISQSSSSTSVADRTWVLSFGQSIYEGTIDFTTGVLTANRILVTLTGDSSESYALSASNRRINYSISGILLNSGVDDTVDGYLCNRFEQITPNQSYRTNMGFAVNTTNSVIFFNDGSGEMTVEGWRTWLASNNIQLVVMLATPLQIQLTPTEISLLQGTNNLWSSTGNLTVQFKNVK